VNLSELNIVCFCVYHTETEQIEINLKVNMLAELWNLIVIQTVKRKHGNVNLYLD